MSRYYLLAIHLVVFIDPRPPVNMTPDAWHNQVMRSMATWVSGPGSSVVVTKDPNDADIRFLVRPLYGPWGRTHNSQQHEFPHVPNPLDNIHIEVDYNCPMIGYTLLHEIGHAFGLRHRPNSIMENGRHRHFELTNLDRVSIEELNK